MGRLGMVGALLVLCACGAELKVGKSIGLTPITGDTKVALSANRACETVDCRVTFNRAVMMATKQELSQLDDAVKAIDLELKELSFTDVERNVKLGADRLRSGTIVVGDDLVIGVAQLEHLPLTLRLEGLALEEVKAQVARGEGATLMIHAEIVIGPPMPRTLLVKYDVQPSLVLGIR